MTFAEHDAAIAEGLDPILRRWGLEYEDQLIEELVGFVSARVARGIEAHARPDNRWAPKKTQRRGAVA